MLHLSVLMLVEQGELDVYAPVGGLLGILGSARSEAYIRAVYDAVR